MPTSRRLSRRQFLQRSTVGAAAGFALPQLLPTGVLAAPGRPGPNDRIGIAVIGTGRRARQLFGDFNSLPKGPDSCRLVACSDVWPKKAQDYVQAFGEDVLKAPPGNVAVFQDYRKLLESADVDAVLIATTEHSRALPCVHACQAGKDIYAEKPLSLTISEGQAIVNAVRKYDRVFQTGTQQRSTPHNRLAAEYVRNGRIGKVHTVVCMNWTSSQPFGDFTIPTEPLPEGLDWDAWCGQTEPVPFSTRVYLTYNEPGWHNITSYSGGSICNHGSHALDCVQWALGADRTGPIEITAKEKRWDAEITYRYANGVEVKLENPPPGGVKEDEKLTAFGAVFHGDKGSLYMHRGRFNTKPISISQEPIREDELHLYRSNHHLQNWFDCIRSRKKCAADVEIGHRSCSVCHLGNIARWTGRKLTWDPEKEVFPGDAEANALLSRRQRHGYELPKDV